MESPKVCLSACLVSIRIFDQAAFPNDFIKDLATATIDQLLCKQEYDPSKVHMPCSAQCVDEIIKKLTDLQTAFKYTATCAIMQKTGTGLHTGMSCYWDSSTDGCQTVRWENKSMYCLCTVFGVTF